MFWQIGLWTYEHFVSMDIFSPLWYFSTHGFFSMGTFWHWNLLTWDIKVWVHHNTRIFRHVAQQYGRFSIIGHFDTVRKCTYVEMSQCCNIPMPECLWRHNVHLPECLPSCKVPVPKKPVMKCPCWNVSCQNVKCRKKPNPIIMYETHKSHWNRKPLL